TRHSRFRPSPGARRTTSSRAGRRTPSSAIDRTRPAVHSYVSDMLNDLLDDVKFGLRLIRKNPLLSAATILTFTLGIGLDAGVFTVIDGLLFRPRVAHDPAS